MDGRRSRSGAVVSAAVRLVPVDLAAVPDVHLGSLESLEMLLRASFALSPLSSHRDASHFPPAGTGSALDAPYDSACRFRFSDTSIPQPAAFRHGPVECTADSTGFPGRTSGRLLLADGNVRSGRSGSRSPVSAHERALQRPEEERCSFGRIEHRGSPAVPVSQGAWGTGPGLPPHPDAYTAISQSGEPLQQLRKQHPIPKPLIRLRDLLFGWSYRTGGKSRKSHYEELLKKKGILKPAWGGRLKPALPPGSICLLLLLVNAAKVIRMS